MKSKTKITAMDRKVNKPRLSLRTAVVHLTRVEKSMITLLFWSGSVGVPGLSNLSPGMLGFNFGAMYSTTGWKNLQPSVLKRMRAYLKKHNLKDWTQQ